MIIAHCLQKGWGSRTSTVPNNRTADACCGTDPPEERKANSVPFKNNMRVERSQRAKNARKRGFFQPRLKRDATTTGGCRKHHRALIRHALHGLCAARTFATTFLLRSNNRDA
ncbi:MAG: hypothetical protein ACO3NZ_01150 [Pirellulales bacterium]